MGLGHGLAILITAALWDTQKFVYHYVNYQKEEDLSMQKPNNYNKLTIYNITKDKPNQADTSKSNNNTHNLTLSINLSVLSTFLQFLSYEISLSHDML